MPRFFSFFFFSFFPHPFLLRHGEPRPAKGGVCKVLWISCALLLLVGKAEARGVR